MRRGRGGRRRRWRSGCGRRRGGRRRVGGTPRRKQFEWVDVGLGHGEPDAEMQIRDVVLSLTGRAGVGDGIALGDVPALADVQRSEMCERGSVSVARHDRHGQPADRDLTRERHLAGRGSPDQTRFAECDVDPPVLSGGERVANREPTQDRAVGGPCPSPGGRAGSERPRRCSEEDERPARCPSGEHGATVARAVGGGNAIDCLVTESRDRGRFERRPSGARQRRLRPYEARPPRPGLQLRLATHRRRPPAEHRRVRARA